MNPAHLQDTSIGSTFSTASTIFGSPPTPPPKPAGEAPPTIPETHDRRTIVVCFDGTGDSFDDDNSNVVELFSMLKKDDPDKQLVYYHTGIGVTATPRYVTAIANKLSFAQDAALATTMDDHIKDGYGFLVQNYKIGDKICLFGFSRGAYTVRALAGMLNKVGLLPQNNGQQIPFAYNLYKEDKDWDTANRFKLAFSIDVQIEFVGVWDTVNAVGVFPSELPFTSSNDSIVYFRHAMALDEHRTKFQIDPWNEPPTSDQEKGIPANNTTLRRPVIDPKTKLPFRTHVKEVWFAGCHCDVGGGSVPNGTPHALAKNPLRWMIRECFKAGSGIMFYTNALKKLGFDTSSPNLGPDFAPLSPGTLMLRDIKSDAPKSDKPVPLAKVSVSVPIPDDAVVETEQQQEVEDALSPVYDELTKWKWWLLEAMPFKREIVEKQPDGSTKLTSTRWPNFKGKRDVLMATEPDGKVLVHRSVKTRLEAQPASDDAKYEVNPSLLLAIKGGQVEWVE